VRQTKKFGPASQRGFWVPGVEFRVQGPGFRRKERPCSERAVYRGTSLIRRKKTRRTLQ